MGKKTPDSHSLTSQFPCCLPIPSPTSQFPVYLPIPSVAAEFPQLVLDRISRICSVIYRKR